MMAPTEIAELREFISGELRKVHIRFDGMDVRFDQVDGRLDRMDQRFEQHAFQAHTAKHVGAVCTRLDDVSARLSRVEVQGEEMRSDFRAFGEALLATNRGLDQFRSDMQGEFRDLRAEMR